ncbi:MAG: BrxA/BrxB family bacilliredoxin [Chitinophagales bacterium]|nr:BrxA/BrxB family bacilliredoxin [Chitinophagales bacterium]
MYPQEMVMPMSRELTNEGFKELKTSEEVNNAIKNNQGTMLLMVNSVCGCAAGTARPGVIESLHGNKKPDNLFTVFAGVDTDATAKAREFMLPYPPSSPSIALFKDNKVVHMIERHQIEGRPAVVIAKHLEQVYEHFC